LAKQFSRVYLEIDHPEKRSAYCSHVCQRIGTKLATLI